MDTRGKKFSVKTTLTYKKEKNNQGRDENTLENYPTIEIWWEVKGHEHYPLYFARTIVHEKRRTKTTLHLLHMLVCVKDAG